MDSGLICIGIGVCGVNSEGRNCDEKDEDLHDGDGPQEREGVCRRRR